MTLKTKTLLMSAAIGAALIAPAAYADSGPDLIIENFVGTVKVTSNNAGKIIITDSQNDADVSYEDTGRNLRIDGNIRKPDGNKCVGYYGRYSWSWNKKKETSGEFGGYKDLKTYPTYEISVPAGTHVKIENAILFGSFPDVGSVDADIDHCGNVRFGDISGEANVRLNGSGDFVAGNAGNVKAILNGSGDVTFETVGNLTAALRGSGDIDAGNTRSADLTLKGSGDIHIGSVDGTLDIALQGSGDVSAQDVSGAVDIQTSGSGDVEIGDVSAAVNLSSRGSSNIDVDGGTASPLTAKVSGSGTIEFDGYAKDAFLTASGSGDIYVAKASGQIRRTESGSGDIDIDEDIDG